jgi:hypothetical protein
MAAQAPLCPSLRTPFQHVEPYECDDDEGYDERGFLHRGPDSDFDACSRYTSTWGGDKEREMASNVGSESYPLSWNMFGTAGKGDTGGAQLLDKISELSAQTPC